MKKLLSLLVLLCCFSATTFSSNTFSAFDRAENSEIKNFDSDDLRPKFRIGFNAPQIDHRQLLLTIDENATDGVDWGYDAQLYQVLNDDMYWVLNDNKYVIQATNDVTIGKEIDLGIVTSNGGIITIGVDAIENPIEGIKVCLKDKELNIIYDIEEVDYQITLAAGEYHNRYAIVFLSTETILNEDDIVDTDSSFDIMNGNTNNPAAKHHLIMYVTNGNNMLNIKNKELINIYNLTLYNKLGQASQVWNSQLEGNLLCMPINVEQGMYIVQATTEIGKISKRIVIKHI